MSRLSPDLLEEMKSIFGNEFGASTPGLLAESELDEARRGATARGRAPRTKDKAKSGKKGRSAKEKNFDTRGAKSIERIARETAAKGAGKAKSREAKGASELEKFKSRFKAVRDSGSKSKAASSGGGGGGASGKEKAGARGGQKHYPFKRSSLLGKGPGTPPGFSGSGPRHHKKTKCWNCSCPSGAYGGCKCTASGSGENCPEKGTVKTINIKKNYKRAYNRMYHPWRAKQSRFRG